MRSQFGDSVLPFASVARNARRNMRESAGSTSLDHSLLNFNALEGLRRAFVAAIKSIELVAGGPRTVRLAMFLQEVRRSLAQLAAKYREVVILCDLHDLSYADVATALRISTAAVRSRLHRGRHLLRQRLLRTKKAGLRDAARSSIRCSV